MTDEFNDNDQSLEPPKDVNKLDRQFPLFGDIDTATAGSFTFTLLKWLHEDMMKPIEVWINTPGGDFNQACAIYDIMRYSTATIRTIGLGQVCSGGVFLLAAGTPGERYVFENTRIMTHQLSFGGAGTVIDMGVLLKEVKQLEDQYVHMLTSTTKLDAAYVVKLFNSNRDIYISPEEALEMGIIDGIIGHDDE